jgi:hypothetical protein
MLVEDCVVQWGLGARKIRWSRVQLTAQDHVVAALCSLFLVLTNHIMQCLHKCPTVEWCTFDMRLTLGGGAYRCINACCCTKVQQVLCWVGVVGEQVGACRCQEGSWGWVIFLYQQIICRDDFEMHLWY